MGWKGLTLGFERVRGREKNECRRVRSGLGIGLDGIGGQPSQRGANKWEKRLVLGLEHGLCTKIH